MFITFKLLALDSLIYIMWCVITLNAYCLSHVTKLNANSFVKKKTNNFMLTNIPL